MFAKDKVSQSMIDAVNSVLMEKKMHDVELDETGLRKAAYAAHKAGQSHFDFQGKKYPVKVQGEEVMAGESVDEASVKVPTKTGTMVYGGAKGGSAKAYLQQKYGDDLADVHGPSDKDLEAIKHEKKKKKEVDEEVEGLDEMDKGGYRATRDDDDNDYTKGKWIKAKPMLAKDATSSAFKQLNKSFNKDSEKKDMKKEEVEEVEELDEDKLALRGLYAPGAPMNDKRGGTGAYSYGVKPRQKTIDKRSQELKDVIKDTLGKHGPKGKLPEEVELKEGYEEIKVHSKDGKHIGTITHGKYQSVAYAHPTTKFGGSKNPHPDEDSTELKGPHDTQSGIDFIHAHHRMMNEQIEEVQEGLMKKIGSILGKKEKSTNLFDQPDVKKDTKDYLKKSAKQPDGPNTVKNIFSKEEDTSFAYRLLQSIREGKGNQPQETFTDNNIGEAGVDPSIKTTDALPGRKPGGKYNQHVPDPKIRLKSEEKEEGHEDEKEDKKLIKKMVKSDCVKEEDVTEAMDTRADVPAFLRKQRGDKPLTPDEVKAKKPDTRSAPGNVKEAEEKEPPFAGPYTKSKGTVTDKSGAKHTPMSRVKDLARQSMKKVKNETLMGTAGATSESVEELDEDAMLDVYLKSRGLNPATITTDKKIAYAKGSDFLRWKQNHS
jgi:hypothetical protein